MRHANNKLMHPSMIVGLIIAAAFADASWAAKGGGSGGGKPGGGDPPPPPVVNYEFHRVPLPADYSFGIPWPRNINTQGEVVGYYPTDSGDQPYYYDVNSGIDALTNLNDLSFASGYQVPVGWSIYAATDINANGDITGALVNQNDSYLLKGFVLEMRPDGGGSPRLHTIPDAAWDHTYASRINDAGQVLGRGNEIEAYLYQAPVHGAIGDSAVDILPVEFDAFYGFMNNASPAQVLTNDATLYSLGDTTASELGPLRTDNFNDSGDFIGSRLVEGKGKKSSNRGYLYQDGQFQDIPELEFAKGLNNSGDIVGRETSGGELLLHADLGLITIESDSVVLFQDDADLDLWNSFEKDFWLVSERGIAGIDPAAADFPYIVGSMGSNGLFFLRPVPVAAAALASAAVPEPNSLAIMGTLVIVGITVYRRRKHLPLRSVRAAVGMQATSRGFCSQT